MASPCDNLNLNLYRVFYTVAKTKSFSESSKVLHVSQPAISKHVQNLEYELNTLLFYRTNRGIELTPEAKKLLVYVEKAYNYLVLGERELEEGQELTKGKISIGIPNFLSTNYLNDTIKKFMNNHKTTKIEISNRNEDELFELFEQHSIDFIIVRGEVKPTKEYKTIELNEEEYCFAIKSQVELEENITSIEQLIEYPLILPSNNTKERKYLNNFLTIKGINLNPIIEVENNELLPTYIDEYEAIGYLPLTIASNNPNLKILELNENLPKEKITLMYNDTTLTNTMKEFINILNTNKTIS